jgi:hypothetical protein
VDLYIHSPIRLHGVVLKFVEHRDNFTFLPTMQFNNVLSVESQSIFRRNMSPPSSELKSKLKKEPSMNQAGRAAIPFSVIFVLVIKAAPFWKTFRHRWDTEVELSRLLLALCLCFQCKGMDNLISL